MRSRPLLITLTALGGLGFLLVLASVIYNIPAVNDRLYPRVDRFMTGLREYFNPLPDVIPTAASVADLPTFAAQTSTPLPSPTATLQSDPPTVQPTDLTPTATPFPILIDLPFSVNLTGTRWEPQLFNNCGPATLTANLVYWGWRGTEPDPDNNLTWTHQEDPRWQRDIANVIKPGKDDKNVMPYELGNYAEEYAGMKYVLRYGGDIDLIRRFVAHEIPVIIERGFREDEHGQTGQGWEGHYSVVTGYNDNTRELLTQDSFKGPNYLKGYDAITRDWRDFNYIYVILYPPEREAQVMSLLGPDADVGQNLNRALLKAQNEAAIHTNLDDLAFDWFNIGTSLQVAGRNTEAAIAFDQARSYGTLPYRMLWYQTFMYKAYYSVERYQDVIDLATVTLQTPGLEESYYWRGWAYYQMGRTDNAVDDMRAALNVHPDWDQALAVFSQWGVSP